MLRALYSSATGMKAQEMMIDNTANNLANVNTPGFKRSRVDFADMIYTNQRTPGTSVGNGQVSPTGLQIGNGVRIVATNKHFAPGTAEQTGYPLDMMIEGDGFFAVQIANGETRYTRAGGFRMDDQGRLVNGDGHLMIPIITIPNGVDVNRITIGTDGSIQGQPTGTDQLPVDLGQIQITTFPNPSGLSNEGSNLYATTAASGPATASNPGVLGFGTIRSGMLEGANVEVVTELISLISAQRAYEINSRAIRAGDEMLSTSVEIVR